MSLVSVIIPAYKAEKFIEETVRSVLAQTHRNLEVIVVDDGSPDQLGQIVQRIAEEDARLRYVRQENSGVSSARNHGFSLCSGEYIAFLDADDLWLPDNLEKKLAKFQAEPDLVLVHSDSAIINEKSERTGEIKTGREGYLLDDLLLWNGCLVPTPSSTLVRRSVVEQVAGFDPRVSNSADLEFFFRVAACGRIGRVHEVTWCYRIHSNNMHYNIPLMEKDALMIYQCADEHHLFKNAAFRRQCYSNMYLIMGASWWGDGKSKWKGIKYLLKAILTYPPNIRKVFRKLAGKSGTE